MKLFILCLGFYLATLTLAAKAQDSTQTDRKDTTALSDTTRTTDSTAEKLPKDSLVSSNSDSSSIVIKNGTTKTTSNPAPSPTNPVAVNPPAQGSANGDSIVDIFEEMKRAKQEQDRSMQKEAPKNATTENPEKKKSATATRLDSSDADAAKDSVTQSSTDTATWWLDEKQVDASSDSINISSDTTDQRNQPGQLTRDADAVKAPSKKKATEELVTADTVTRTSNQRNQPNTSTPSTQSDTASTANTSIEAQKLPADTKEQNDVFSSSVQKNEDDTSEANIDAVAEAKGGTNTQPKTDSMNTPPLNQAHSDAQQLSTDTNALTNKDHIPDPFEKANNNFNNNNTQKAASSDSALSPTTPERDTIKSLFTRTPAVAAIKSAVAPVKNGAIRSTTKTPMVTAQTKDNNRVTDSSSHRAKKLVSGDSTAISRDQHFDSSRQQQDTAMSSLFSEVEKEKAVPTPDSFTEARDSSSNSISSDNTAKTADTVKANRSTNGLSENGLAVADSSLTLDKTNQSNQPQLITDSSNRSTNTNEGTAGQRLTAARAGLDSTINSTKAVQSGTPFTQLFEPYRKFRKNTTIESTTSLTILQQHVNYKTKADFSTAFQRTGREGSGYLFDVSVVRLNTEVETMGVQLKYDSKTPTDSTSTFAKPLFDIVGKRTFLKVDSTGKIMAVDTSQIGQQINTVLSGLSLSGGDYEVGSNFGLLINNTDALKVGATWQDSISQGDNQRTTSYKVQNLVDDEFIILISGTVAQTGEIASDGVVFKTHFSGTQKGKMRVDKATRLIKTKEINLDMKGTVDYQDNELPASATSIIKESVTEQ